MVVRHVHPRAVKDAAKKRITILGATGSIGDSTLDVIRQQPQMFDVVCLTAHSNLEKLVHLARELKPKLAVIGDVERYFELKTALEGTGIKAAAGIGGLQEAASMEADVVMCAIVGAAGLVPTLTAIAQGRCVAIANKEALVCAGELVMQACLKHGTRLLPVDSEHNAIFQVLATDHRDAVEKMTLTASGGPFLRRDLASLHHVTPEEAVAHPRWNMGAKVSVDSATMMNKALELIEAHYLFAMPPETLEVVIHPESIVHSLVHYADGSVLAQLGMPDMRVPISYALAWPKRIAIEAPRLNLSAISALHFEAVDPLRFPAIDLARQALTQGPSQLITLNAANEVAVGRFLRKEIRFTDIIPAVESALSRCTPRPVRSIEDVVEIDQAARSAAMKG